MKESNFWKLFYCVTLFLLFITFNSCEKEVTKPNVVLFIVDDLGWKDVAIYGSNFYKTPNINFLASEGVHLLMLMLRVPYAHEPAPVL